MNGYFEHAQVAITAPHKEGVSSWVIQAKAISYEITDTGLITLRITQEKHVEVKVEPDDDVIKKDEVAPKSEKEQIVHHESRRRKKKVNANGKKRFGSMDANEEDNDGEMLQRATTDLQQKVECVESDAPNGLKKSPTRASEEVDYKGPVVRKFISLQFPLEGKSRGKCGPKEKDQEKTLIGGNDRAEQSVRSMGTARTGQEPRRCSVDGCSSLRQGARIPHSDSLGPAGYRCKRHGGRRRCSVDGCPRWSECRIPNSDRFGPPGIRCLRHSDAKKCTANGCAKQSQRRVYNADRYGPPGGRCKRHGGGVKCSVKECTSFSQGRVLRSDRCGPPGARCFRHGGGRKPSAVGSEGASSTGEDGHDSNALDRLRETEPEFLYHPQREGGRKCDVLGCALSSGGRVCYTDSYGPPGLRCIQHGVGSTCSVEGCIRQSVSRVRHTDGFGPSGGRCIRHGGGSRCSVEKCTSSAKGRAPTSDRFGPPGLRCIKHGGGKKCSVKECAKLSQGRVPNGDNFGPPGPRCKRHRGGQRCSVKECSSSSQGQVSHSDRYGGPGPRCYAHGRGRCSVKGLR